AFDADEVRKILQRTCGPGELLWVHVPQDDRIVVEELISRGEFALERRLIDILPPWRSAQQHHFNLNTLTAQGPFRLSLQQDLHEAKIVTRISFHIQHAESLGLGDKYSAFELVIATIGLARNSGGDENEGLFPRFERGMSNRNWNGCTGRTRSDRCPSLL